MTFILSFQKMLEGTTWYFPRSCHWFQLKGFKLAFRLLTRWSSQAPFTLMKSRIGSHCSGWCPIYRRKLPYTVITASIANEVKSFTSTEDFIMNRTFTETKRDFLTLRLSCVKFDKTNVSGSAHKDLSNASEQNQVRQVLSEEPEDVNTCELRANSTNQGTWRNKLWWVVLHLKERHLQPTQLWFNLWTPTHLSSRTARSW